jgi:hypothetical protein
MTITIDDIKGMNLQVGDKIEVKLTIGNDQLGYYQEIFNGTKNEKHLAISRMNNGKSPISYELNIIQEIKKLTYEKK